jgi:hypothetical protein
MLRNRTWPSRGAIGVPTVHALANFATRIIEGKRWLVAALLEIHSLVRAGRGFIAVAVGGAWNAYLLSRTANPADSVAVIHVGRERSADLATFAARLADAVSAHDGAAATNVDLILLVEGDVCVARYLTVARFFNKQINLHAIRDIGLSQKIVPSIASSNVVERLNTWGKAHGSAIPVSITTAMVGCFRPPPLYAHLARDFCKMIDVSKKYCMIGLPSEWRIDDLDKALPSVIGKCPNWRFIVVTEDWGAEISTSATTPLISPTFSGLDFGTQVSLAAEADAFIGSSSVFALAALLSGKPVTLLGNRPDSVQISAELTNMRAVNDLEPAQLAGEIELLLDRANCGNATWPQGYSRVA